MNNGRYTLCPYYMSEHNKSIRCEDTLRTFRWKPQKDRWMDSYCDSNWQACRWAQELEKAYEGSDEELEEQKINALETEIRALTSKLGRAEKRCAEKDEEIRKARRNKDKWERAYQRKAKEAADVARDLRLQQNLNNDLCVQFEARIAYLIDVHTDGRVTEDDICEWIKNTEYALVTDKDEKGHVCAWMVKKNVK